MKNLLKEPLVHFLGLGALLYISVYLMFPEQLQTENPYEIIVNDDALSEFMQFQAKRFAPGDARRQLARMTETDRQQLVNEYVREQVLYREALALGLDKNDLIIRRRLMQKMEFISRGFVEDMPKITEVGLQQYFQKNAESYRLHATVSFTHIFFSNRKHGAKEAIRKAKALLPELKQASVQPVKASSYGDRFLFHRNYQEKSHAILSAHFGAHFSEKAFAAKAQENWQGPFVSQYGVHLLWLSHAKPSRIPELAEVAPTVLQDMRREQQNRIKRKAYERVMQKYTVILRETSGNTRNRLAVTEQ